MLPRKITIELMYYSVFIKVFSYKLHQFQFFPFKKKKKVKIYSIFKKKMLHI